jgi:hypothetical protein
METGLWNCKRGECKASGKLADFWEERPKLNRRDFARQQLRRVCELPAVEAEAPSDAQIEKANALQTQLEGLRPIEGTGGAAYLLARGVSLEVTGAAGVRFSPNWFGRAAVYFPLHNRAGDLVAAQGRYLDGRTNPKARTIGDKKAGLFAAAGAWNIPTVILTEAPIDALSLAVAGFPSLALCGTSGPAWLSSATFGRRVILAFDADDAGDRAADELAPSLESFGATCARLRPEGAKDWNEFLTLYGADALSDYLAPPILAGTQRAAILIFGRLFANSLFANSKATPGESQR